MNIKIETEEQLLDVARKLIHAAVNLRHWQKKWSEQHGVYAKDRKKYWEEKMDSLLLEIGAEYGKEGQYSGKEPVGIFIKKD